MRNPLVQSRWSPYVVGAGIGVLSWITFALMNSALGTSTTFVRLAGLIEGLFSTSHVENNEYLAKHVVKEAAVDWQMLLVLGILIGAFLSAWLGRSTQRETIPALWAWRFGKRTVVRYAGAFIGGVLVLFGARMAGGCTSGHGISGALQLSVGSWVFFASFFAVGVLTAFVLFGKEGRSHV